MADTLRIKRRAAGGAVGPPSSLAAAELAFNEQDQTLYYGAGNSAGTATSIYPIGGPGGFWPKSQTAVITISATAPSSPVVGMLWWDTIGGWLYVWYDDGTSQQWVGTGL